MPAPTPVPIRRAVLRLLRKGQSAADVAAALHLPLRTAYRLAARLRHGGCSVGVRAGVAAGRGLARREGAGGVRPRTGGVGPQRREGADDPTLRRPGDLPQTHRGPERLPYLALPTSTSFIALPTSCRVTPFANGAAGRWDRPFQP